MKFLHAADIHLDSVKQGIARDAEVPAHVTADITRRALANLVSLAIAEDVAFVVIAGDIFDADWRDYTTGLFFAQQMQRLAPRPCFVVRGNHDAHSVVTKRLQLPPNVREFSSRVAQSLPADGLDVVLHGRSFPERAVPEDLAAQYPPPQQGRLNIGVLHTSADDAGGVHARYAPCSVAALQAKGYDYWALGHIHDRRILAGAPSWVVFPGNLQGRHANETGAKGAMLVTVQDRRIVAEPEFRPLDVLRWAAIDVTLEGVEDRASLAARTRDALAAHAAAAEGRPVIARVTLRGASALHPTLLADPKAAEAECRNAAIALGAEIYIESVRIETRPQSAAPDSEALAMLREACLASLEDLALTDRLLSEFKALADLVPHGDGTPPDLPRDPATLRALADDAWELVRHALARNPDA